MKPQEFLDQLLGPAQVCQRASGIPASFTLAQAALESSWGESKTAAMAHNLFNIKADKSWHGPIYQMPSTEHIGGRNLVVPANWRMYPDWQACFDDRALFFKLNARYAACFKETTGAGWARAVARAGYATDPDYAAKLIAVMDGRAMSRFDTLP